MDGQIPLRDACNDNSMKDHVQSSPLERQPCYEGFVFLEAAEVGRRDLVVVVFVH